jgi:hypothetical protein
MNDIQKIFDRVLIVQQLVGQLIKFIGVQISVDCASGACTIYGAVSATKLNCANERELLVDSTSMEDDSR